jgi:HD-GYP domain-containing protein (c-di-GMP phosphodiesterase class II)
LLRYLATATKHRTMYPPEHPIVKRALEDLVQVVGLLLHDRDAVTFQIYSDTFFLDNQMLPEESLRNTGLLTGCLDRNVGLFELRRGITSAEVHAFVGLLNTSVAALKTAGGPEALLKTQGVEHIVVGPPRDAPPTDMPIEVEPTSAYEAGHTVAQELRAQAARRQPLDMNKARVFLSAAIEVVLDNRTALLTLMTGKNYDESSSYHAVNVAILALLMGTRLGLEREALMALGMGALLHDIGKVRIPQSLLNRATELGPQDQDLLNRHPAHGGNILRDLEGLGRIAAVCALEHHVHFDGGGYPALVGKTRPHLFSRIVAVADAYDTVTSARRGTQRPLRVDLAMRWIAVGLGSVYDPVVGKAFLRMMGAYPVGSLVQLDRGELAVVMRPSETRVDRPMVQVLTDGRPTDIIDLMVDTTRWISVGIDPADVNVDVEAVLTPAESPTP